MFDFKPELLSPAGDWECLRAAVANGADCVYFGLPSFNARIRADNFTEADLPEVMDFLHKHGKRGYLTLNVLIFTRELGEAVRMLRLARDHGVDAVIIQDLGLAKLAHVVAPGIRVHASTQMTITSSEGIDFARGLGVEQVVLARELSLRELAKFREETKEGESFMPLEVFVHGALCVAYSGQCLTSESLGQRSANRGECAQACRLPYELLVDGKAIDLGDRKYLLSPQDLAAVDEISDLIRLGVKSFKIEGRLKSPEYVAAVTRVYRKAIDGALAGMDRNAVDKRDKYELEMAFSRGFFSGWFHGVNHQRLVHARFGKKRGPFVGNIGRVGRDFVEVDAETELAPGDGVCFDTGEDTEHEQGGRIYQIEGKRLYFQHGKIRFNELKEGDRIWKTDDPKLNKALRKTFEESSPLPGRPVDLVISGKVGEPLMVEAILDDRRVKVSSEMLLQTAVKHPLSSERVREQMGRLGDTTFELGNLKWDVWGNVMLPVSELNRLRREWVAALDVREEKKIEQGGELKPLLDAILEERKSILVNREDSLSVLCRSIEQVEAALESGTGMLYADFEDIRRYKDAVSLVRSGAYPDAKLYLATPRIQKSGEQGFFKLIENCNPDGVLIRNLGGLAYFRGTGLPAVGDFSLNVANPLTAKILMDGGLERVTISYDLNVEQVVDLVKSAPASWFELSLHQHMPMFHMEHCVFAAFLSDGTDHTNCGRPCDRHRVQLRDRVGQAHPVKADVGCRNTVFNASAQSGAAYLRMFREAGVRAFRVELLNEGKDRSRQLIEAYRKLFAGEVKAGEMLDDFRIQSQLGVVKGTWEVKNGSSNKSNVD